jgi:predicted dehydrogenase
MTTLSPRAAGKFVRFVTLYGLRRTVFKAVGRLRFRIPFLAFRRAHRPDIAIIGCGQFALATIGYFLQHAFGRRIVACYDVQGAASESFARLLRVPRVCSDVEDLLGSPGLRTVYIASNHASHAPYAIAAIERGLDVYVEKPIAVTRPQLVALLRALRGSESRVFAGYNRPFAGAIRDLRRYLQIDANGAISLQCFVSGHRIGPDHWYRDPREGTRVCGNIGHWLDLLVHVLGWRGLPDRIDISLAWADENEPDDNLNVAITTDRQDLFCVMLTSRCEPFEGINETINFQHGETICKIDDFRSMSLWQGPRLVRRRYWPKDVGHRLAILQPFRQDAARDWREVVASTLLMLHITEMVRARQHVSTFSFAQSWQRLNAELEAG